MWRRIVLPIGTCSAFRQRNPDLPAAFRRHGGTIRRRRRNSSGGASIHVGDTRERYRLDGRIHHPPHPVHGPDAARDPAGVVHRGAVRAGRAGRARDRADFRLGHRRNLAHLGLAGRRLRRARGSAGAARRRCQFEVSRRAGPRSGVHQEPGKAVRFRQAGLAALPADDLEFHHLRFRQELFPRRECAAADQGEASGLDVARHLDDAAHLPDFDSARHPQGGERRLALRYLDVEHHHRRLCDPRLSVRDPADHFVCRRLLLGRLPLARAHLRQLGRAAVVRQGRRLLLAFGAADRLDGARRLRDHDAADEEFVSRRDPQAVCADRARQGLHQHTGSLRPHLPQRDADRDRGIPRRVRARLLHRRAADRDDLLARRPRAARLRKRTQPRLPGGVRHAVHFLARGPLGEPARRSHLHLGRSAHRLRDAGGVSVDARTDTPDTTVVGIMGVDVPPERRPLVVSPINRRRWQNFKANRRGYWAFWIFMVLFVVTLFAEFLATDKPFFVRVDGKTFIPVIFTYPETAFGGEFETAADYRDPYLKNMIADKGGAMHSPPIHFSYSTHNLNLPTPAPS